MKKFMKIIALSMSLVMSSGIYAASPNYAVADEIEENTMSAPDDFTQRIFVVDYETKELIHFDDDKLFPISFHTGYEVEYVLTEGGFAWGVMWGPESEWDYNAHNPFVIDIAGFSGGFGVGAYEVIDIDLSYGYFLPEDYLETVDYDNGSTDIYIKLKKTLSGDVNADGKFSVADVVLLQKWLLSAPNTNLTNWKAADLNGDGALDVFDLTLMRKALLEENGNNSRKSVEYTVLDEEWTWATGDNFRGRIDAASTYDEMCEIIESTDGYEYMSSALYERLSDKGVDEKFFDDKIVIVLYGTVGGSTRNITIDEITKEQNSLTVYTTTRDNGPPSPDMRSYRMILAIDSADFYGVTEVSNEDNFVAYWE